MGGQPDAVGCCNPGGNRTIGDKPLEYRLQKILLDAGVHVLEQPVPHAVGKGAIGTDCAKRKSGIHLFYYLFSIMKAQWE